MVYLIVDSEKKFCKIGYSANPEKRIKQLQRETILKLEIACVIVGNLGTERYIHSRYSHRNASREWYKFHPDILEYFQKCYNDSENVAYRASIATKTE